MAPGTRELTLCSQGAHLLETPLAALDKPAVPVCWLWGHPASQMGLSRERSPGLRSRATAAGLVFPQAFPWCFSRGTARPRPSPAAFMLLARRHCCAFPNAVCCVLLKVYCCRPLALAFLELTVVRRFHEHVHQPDVPSPLRAVLGRLSALYALWSLNQHTALLYRGEPPAQELGALRFTQETLLSPCGAPSVPFSEHSSHVE